MIQKIRTVKKQQGEREMKSTFPIKTIVFMLTMLADLAQAVIIHVPADQATIQDGINAANHFDHVVVAPGTYFEAINFSGKGITLRSASGNPADTIIDGTGNFHVVQCVSGETPVTRLEGFTITGGNANGGGNDSHGGGMFTLSSSPTVVNCIFSGNSATGNGGGLYTQIGSGISISQCTFTGNNAGSHGGGFYNISINNLNISQCTFTNNSAGQRGGGLSNSITDPVVTDCTFTGNTAVDGGGIGVGSSNSVISRCNFYNNSTTNFGGAMYCGSSHPSVTNCFFAGNSAVLGGAITSVAGSPFIRQSVFSGNSASSGGAGVYSFLGGTVVIIQCTFSNNLLGGAITIGSPSVGHVHNCILWQNTPGQMGGNITATYNCVEGGFAGTGNISGNPLFVDVDGADNILGTLDDNVRLQAGSSVIDAANAIFIPSVTLDYDNNVRYVDDISIANSGAGDCPVVDMGAFEFQAVGGDTDGDDVPDICDICPGFDDNVDSDSDGTPDGCDLCPGFNDTIDSDGDSVPDGCDACPGFDDTLDEDGDGIPDGCDTPTVHNLTQLTDHFTLQVAINASVNGDVIEADPGMYNEAITFNGKSIVLRSSSGNPKNTIINGTGNFHVVQCINGEDPNTILEGFTITGGDANGAGINDKGAGIICQNSSPTITHCIIRDNISDNQGGGIFNESSHPVVSYCMFMRNSSRFNLGGGMANIFSNPIVSHSLFSGNIAEFGAGGGIANEGSSEPVITNTTFSHNESGFGGAIFSDSGTSIINNSILWQNIPDQIGGGSPTVNDSIVEGGWAGTGSNNLSSDPLFVDADGVDNTAGTLDDDLRLQPGSPAIDAANNNVLSVSDSIDLAGRLRRVDDLLIIDTGNGTAPIVDMGAYEYACMGNLNEIAAVTLADFALFTQQWLQTDCGFCTGADFNADNSVTEEDLYIQIVNWFCGI